MFNRYGFLFDSCKFTADTGASGVFLGRQWPETSDNAMGKAISAYLVNFAKTGDPNGAGLPVWPRYERAKDEIMDFAANGKALPGRDRWGTELDAVAR